MIKIPRNATNDQINLACDSLLASVESHDSFDENGIQI